MKKFLGVTWLPIAMAAVILAIYGGGFVLQNQKQNFILKGRIDQLAQRIDQLEKETNVPVQVAGEAISKPSATPVPQPIETQPTSMPTPTATLTPLTTPTRILTPRSSLTPIMPVLSPTPIPTPTPTPTPIPRELMAVEIQGLGNFQVELKDGDTAFSVLLQASLENHFIVSYQNYGDLGAFVNCIDGVCGHDNYYWAFYYNGQYSPVGASSQPVSSGDVTTWKFETW